MSSKKRTGITAPVSGKNLPAEAEDLLGPVHWQILDYAYVEEMASQGLTGEQIGRLLGATIGQINYKRKMDPQFEEAIQRGRSRGVEKVASELMKNALNGNVAAQIFFLKTQGGWREKEREASVQQNVNVQAVFLAPERMNPKDFQKMLAGERKKLEKKAREDEKAKLKAYKDDVIDVEVS